MWYSPFASSQPGRPTHQCKLLLPELLQLQSRKTGRKRRSGEVGRGNQRWEGITSPSGAVRTSEGEGF